MMAALSAQVDAVFRGLSNPTRRQVMERLAAGPASAGDLAEPFAVALPSFLQHMRVLEDSGLVRSTKTGRVRIFEILPGGLRVGEDWLGQQRATWEGRLDRLDDYLDRLRDHA
jgi:DNA-binding transcriptional ArsR family regulator